MLFNLNSDLTPNWLEKHKNTVLMKMLLLVQTSWRQLFFISFSASAAEKKHALFGRPRMLQPDQSYCILYQEGFISAYSHKALMPLWSSFTIDKPVSPLTGDKM